MRFYVYALIDPTDHNRPLYIGKGLSGRLQSHFTNHATVGEISISTEVVGCDTASLVADAKEHLPDRKGERLARLISRGYTHQDIARVIARRVSEPIAFALESFLIRSVYGLDTLCNRVEGAYAERYRPKGDWGFIDGFDLPPSASSGAAPHYVYALRDPKTSRIIYVGKGCGGRVWQHFKEASAGRSGDKLDELRRLLAAGHTPYELARILAWLDDEATAFALEALAVKFVYGLSDLENIQPGNNHGLFRARGDWQLRRGFDLPFVVEPGVRQDRIEMLDGMLGEGLDRPLLEIQKRFPELKFGPPKILDSADLGIEADVVPHDGAVGARLKVFIRRARIQIELRPRRKAQRDWIKAHFTRLNAYPLRRRDDVFFPDAWRSADRMANDVEEATTRVRQILQIMNAQRREDLPEATRGLLERNT